MPKKLLYSLTKKDFKISYFSGRGAGGQHRNKHQNCVRLSHPESGVTAIGQSHKERSSNIKEAFNNLVNNTSFKLWHNRKIHEVLMNKSIEDVVEEMMKEENLKIETKVDGKWTEVEKGKDLTG